MNYPGPANARGELGYSSNNKPKDLTPIDLTPEAKSILQEINNVYQKNNFNLIESFEEINDILDPLTEATYERVFEHLRLEILDVDRFVKVNDCKPVTDPRAFIRDNIPSPNGLLSNLLSINYIVVKLDKK